MTSHIKRIIITAASAAALLMGAAAPAAAQIAVLPQVTSVNASDLVQDIPRGVPGVTSVWATLSAIRSFALGQGLHTGAPTLTTTTSVCGGTTAAVNGTDVSGQVAEGTTASTSCVITFATPFLTAPECFVSLNNVADTALKCAATTTAATVTQTSASSNVLNYLIVGLPGG